MSAYPEHSVGFKDRVGDAGHAAVLDYQPKVNTRRQEALEALRRRGPSSAADIAQEVGRHWTHVAPRLSDLLALGLACKAEGRGKSAFGRPATLYRATTPEERALFAARKALAEQEGPNNG